MFLDKRKFVIFSWLLILLIALAGCSSGTPAPAPAPAPAPESKIIKLGFAAPLSGSSAQDGESMKNGATLAAELINKAGGINGAQIEFVYEDDKSDPKEAAAIANKFASDKDILAVVGHFNSSCTLAGAPIYNKATLVEISGGSSSPAVSDAGPYTFRTITTDAFQGQYLVDWAINDEGFKKIAVVYENTDYGQGILQVVEAEAPKLGGEMVAKEAYVMGQTTDFSSIVTKVKAAKPDVIIIGGLYNETALFAKQAQRSALSAPIMGVDGIYSDALIELGGDAVEGVMLTGFFFPSSTAKESQDFIAAYKAAYNEEPGTYAAYTFDAASIVIEALKKGAADRQGIADYLTDLQGFKGATGVTNFDANGDCIKDPLKLIVKEGKFVVK